MKGFLLIALTCVVSSMARGSSPLELSITKLALPKLTVTVKNTDAGRNLRMWIGGSRCEQIFHFEVFDRSGKAIAKYYHQYWGYTGNCPIAYEFKPGEIRAFDFDLSDKNSWIQPEKVDLKHSENLSFCAVLNQHLEVESHKNKVFTGEVKSPWNNATKTNGTGSCVEWDALPPHRDGPPFDSALFLEGLGKLRIRQDNAKANLLECLGSDLPWNQVALISGPGDFWGPDHQAATLLLPDAITITLIWDTKESLSTAEKLQLTKALKLPKFGDAADKQPGWAIASESIR
jgi:hypothetical protein